MQISAVGLALTKYSNVSKVQYSELRQQANTECLFSAVMLNETLDVKTCDNRYCLFNIINDPCEVEDLSDIRPDVLYYLLEKLKYFNTTVVSTSNTYKSDPRAHPKYWNNYWIPWLDVVPDIDSSSDSPNFKPVNVYLFKFLIITTYILITNSLKLI